MAIFSIITASLAAAGFTGAVTIFGLSPALSAALISVGKAVLWNQVAKALAPSVPAEQVQATIAQAVGPRIRGYGEFLLGGTRALWEPKGGVLHQIAVAHHGPLSSLVRFEVDGEAVTVGGSGNVTSGSTVGYLTLKAILSGDGGAHSGATSAFPTLWTSAHKLTGLATVYARLTAPKLSKFQQVFPRGDQTAVAIVARLSPVMDPRTEVVAYSNLTGPCVLDYLTHDDGYRIPLAQVDLAGFADFTDLCDQDVALRAGGTEKRYRVGGYYSLEDAPKDVLQRLLDTADAQCYMTTDGTIGIMGGEWLDPDVIIGADDVLALTLTDGTDDFSDFNVLKGQFTSPEHRYQATEVAEWRNEVALVTQPERVESLTVDLCPSQSQMQRLMHAYKARKLPEYTGTLRTNLVGLKARFPRGQGRHVISVLDDDGDEYLLEVLSHSYSVTDRTCEMQVQTVTNGYLWTAATDERDPPPPLDGLERPSDATPVPTGLAVSQEVVTISATQNAVRLVAQVADPGRALQLQAEYKKSSASVWQPMLAGIGDLRAYSAVLSDGASYNVRAAWAGYEVYSATVTVTAVSNPTAPDAPTAFTSALASGTVTLDWTNGDAGYYRTRLYRAPTTDFNDAALVGSAISGVAALPSTAADTPGIGTWSYWVATINASGVESAPVGPETHII